MNQPSLLELFLKHPKVCTDTRSIEKGCLFFALKGDNFNGNLFANEALEKGAAAAIVDEPVSGGSDNVVLVDNVLEALQNLANAYRRTFDIPVIGITGSNGKTTTKELMWAVLSRKYKTHFTQGNLNNHIGVPLTLLSMPGSTEIAIIEMGANHQREIALLCTIAQPTHGLITNIGKAHLEGFGGLEGVKRGKGELFDYIRKAGGKVFVNRAVDHVLDLATGMNTELFDSSDIEVLESHPHLTLTWPGCSAPCKTQLTGLYNLHNIAAAVKLGQYFGVDNAAIAMAIASYTPSNNRSQLHHSNKNALILDAYNANPSSMSLALENLAAMPGADRFFIIGDMLELGADSETEHALIVKRAEQLGLEGILVGKIFCSLHQDRFRSFPTNTAAREFLEEENIKNRTILIKGSRGIRLEAVVDVL